MEYSRLTFPLTTHHPPPMYKTMLLIALLLSCKAPAQRQVRCVISTSLGNITIIIFPEKAPLTVQNFLYYVDHHLYDSSSFFRVCTPDNEAGRKIPIQVIQGGNVPAGKQANPVELETTRQTGLQHKNGTVSMARNKPNSATSEFFICINDQPELDYAGKRNPDGQGFAAFGKVKKGTKVVKRIQQQANKDQYLINPVIIYRISRKN